jgi:hypothetical protein
MDHIDYRLGIIIFHTSTEQNIKQQQKYQITAIQKRRGTKNANTLHEKQFIFREFFLGKDHFQYVVKLKDFAGYSTNSKHER